MDTQPIICDICNKTITSPKVVNQKWHDECRDEGNRRYRKQRYDANRSKVPFMKKTCYCGKKFETRNPKRVMCRDPGCLYNYQKTHTLERFKTDPQRQKKYEYEKRVDLIEARKNESQTIDAICPGCGIIHQYTFEPAWIGRGVPRVNCMRYPYCISYDLRAYGICDVAGKGNEARV